MSDDIHNQLYRKDIGTSITLSGDEVTIRTCRIWCNSNLKSLKWLSGRDDDNKIYTLKIDGREINYCFLYDKDAIAFKKYIESDLFKRDTTSPVNQGSWINSNAKSIPVIK